MTGRLTATTRELACLALAHDDADEPRCRSTDEQLVADLVREVRLLRARAGIGDEPIGERDAGTVAVDDALDEIATANEARIELSAAELVAHLADGGWQLVRVGQ